MIEHRMEITINPASSEDLSVVQNLGRFYVYEMSRYCGFLKGWETPSNGLYECIDLSVYWNESNRYPFLIKIDNELAGFVLVNKIGSSPEVDWNMGEFFIVSKYQKKGVGHKVAVQIFKQFPGVWEVMQIPENKGAINFWEKVINCYTDGQFSRTQKVIPTPTPHPMIVLKFDSASCSRHQAPSDPFNHLEEYTDPLDYDLEYGQYSPEEDAFYHALSLQAKGPILDLACGTGRITIPLAKKGFEIFALDLSSKMLTRAKEKASVLGLSIHWIEEDCRHFYLPKKFGCIFMAGNAFQAMLTNEDQNKLLSSVREHLLSDGLFVFDTRNPDLIELSAYSVEENWHKYKNSCGKETQVSGYHSYDSLSQIAIYTTVRKSEQGNSEPKVRKTQIKLRYTYPQELETLLKANGLRLVDRFGGYDKQKFNGKQQQMICLCMKS